MQSKMELNLAKDAKSNKNGFYRCVSQKGKFREGALPGWGRLANCSIQMRRRLSYSTVFSPSIFTVNLYFKNIVQGMSPLTRKRKMLHPFKKEVKKENPGKCCFSSLTTVLEKTVEQILLQAMLRHMEDKEVIQESFTGHFLPRTISSWPVQWRSMMSTSVHKGRAMNTICQYFYKALDTVLHNI